jgi:hypothetical protein
MVISLVDWSVYVWYNFESIIPCPIMEQEVLLFVGLFKGKRTNNLTEPRIPLASWDSGDPKGNQNEMGNQIVGNFFFPAKRGF